MTWVEKRNITITHIQPGKPQQNAYVEHYNRTVRHEWLGCFIFDTIKEVQDHATRWLWTYNNDRPNMAISGVTPRQKLKMAAGHFWPLMRDFIEVPDIAFVGAFRRMRRA